MKTIDIITRDMHQLHGANRVTEKLIFGRELFLANGYDLRYVVSRDGILDCSQYTDSTLGVELGTNRYITKRRIIENLKKLPVYQTKTIQTRIVKREIDANNSVLSYIKILNNQADLVIFQDPMTAIYCLHNGFHPKASIFISHADRDPLEQLLLSRPALAGTSTEKWLRDELKKLYFSVNRVVTICKSSQKYMHDTFGLDCPCIHNGIEDADISRCEKLSSKDGRVHIAIVASLQYRKGQDIAIEALNLLDKEDQGKIRLHLFGDGKDRQFLQNLTNHLGLDESVIFHGAVLNVHDNLTQMDAFLLPSRADTVPISIIEAMRAGLPVFGTNVGEISNMIESCGELVETDTKNISTLYKRLMNQEVTLDIYAGNARLKYEQEYTLGAMIKQYLDVFNMII